MAIFTKQAFESVIRNKVGSSALEAYVNESRAFSRSSATTSIFLSHSHKDNVLVRKAKVFFEKLGITIYVDWADQTMPELTNGVTAKKIKDKILQNDKFILLATNDAIISKWCNWEVGYADTHKYIIDKICLLPLADNSGTWHGNEYLQIYPRLEESEITPGFYRVIYPDGSWKSLSEWLKK